jgi:hypothetical protein
VPAGALLGPPTLLTDSAGARPFRRLTADEFHNAVRDLLGEPRLILTDYPNPSDGQGLAGVLETGTKDFYFSNFNAIAEHPAGGACPARRLAD